MNLNEKNSARSVLYFLIVMLIAVLSRTLFLGKIPGGINQDEAFAGYEAYCLMTTGSDSFGYRFPVHLMAWGSGMNALESYLMIPFVRLLGIHTWVFRIPQVVIGIITVFVVYCFLKEHIDQKAALLGMVLITVCPWHIMMSRWGLESNLAPGFLMLGMYFMAKTKKHSGYMVLSALFYGLSLYTYATVWLIVPFLILLQIGYLYRVKCFRWDKYVTLSFFLLFLLAAPLILFLLVNKGILPEIRGKIISIPKMVYMRDGWVGVRNVGNNMYTLLKTLITQQDGLVWNATEKFGLYYHGFSAFALIGLAASIRCTVKSVRERTFAAEPLILIWFLCSFLQGCLMEVNINRMNSIHIPMILLMGIGVYRTVFFFEKKGIRWGMPCIVGALLVIFGFFWKYYTTEYRQTFSFYAGIEDAVFYAQERAQDGQVISVNPEFDYPMILVFSGIDPDEYRETVVYDSYSDFSRVKSFGQYEFSYDRFIPENVYIITGQEINQYLQRGFQVEIFETVAVAYME